MSATINIVEVGPRDGLQNEDRALPVESRVKLINQLIDCGARRIEAVSFVRDDLVPQMAGAEDVLKELPNLPGVSYIGLVLNRRGAERAVQVDNCHELNIAIPVTDEFCQRNQGSSVESMLTQAAAAAEVGKSAGRRVSITLAVAFGCPFSGVVETDQVAELVDRVADLNIDELAFADTIGVGRPGQVTALGQLVSGDPRIPLVRFHFHNTRNTGYANAYAASQLSGFDRVVLDSSVGGFGGCPFAPNATGNIATEDLSYLLRDVDHDQLDLAGLTRTADWLAEELDTPAPGLLTRAGDFPGELAQ